MGLDLEAGAKNNRGRENSRPRPVKAGFVIAASGGEEVAAYPARRDPDGACKRRRDIRGGRNVAWAVGRINRRNRNDRRGIIAAVRTIAAYSDADSNGKVSSGK